MAQLRLTLYYCTPMLEFEYIPQKGKSSSSSCSVLALDIGFEVSFLKYPFLFCSAHTETDIHSLLVGCSMSTTRIHILSLFSCCQPEYLKLAIFPIDILLSVALL